MKAKDIISSRNDSAREAARLLPMKHVDAELSLLEVLPLLLEAPEHLLGVEQSGDMLGVIDEASLLEGMGRLIAGRDDSSVVTIECEPTQYSASSLAHAVEDAGVHLVDLISAPGESSIRVTLRVRTLDPASVISSLERYGFRVVESGEHPDPGAKLLAERLASLQALINV